MSSLLSNLRLRKEEIFQCKYNEVWKMMQLPFQADFYKSAKFFVTKVTYFKQLKM